MNLKILYNKLLVAYSSFASKNYAFFSHFPFLFLYLEGITPVYLCICYQLACIDVITILFIYLIAM